MLKQLSVLALALSVPLAALPADAYYPSETMVVSIAPEPQADVDSDSYPRVTTLEKDILGKSFGTDDLATRLSRLETKAFGKSSSDPDLGARTDALQDYAEKTLHKTVVAPGPGYEDAGDNSDAPDNGGMTYADNAADQSAEQANTGDYPHVTALEQAILNKTFAGEDLTLRLNRLETKAFGKPSEDPDLSARTDRLERYAEKELHVKPLQDDGSGMDEGQQQQQDGSSGANRSRQILSFVGNSLLGMTGMGLMGPGMGPAAMGFGGVRVRNRADVQPDSRDATAEPVNNSVMEDPLVYEVKAPPPESKLLTKVGWCEVQVFGHTFNNLHLRERLDQLNRELKVMPGKSALELMDNVPTIMQAVEKRQIGANPSASAPQPR